MLLSHNHTKLFLWWSLFLRLLLLFNLFFGSGWVLYSHRGILFRLYLLLLFCLFVLMTPFRLILLFLKLRAILGRQFRQPGGSLLFLLLEGLKEFLHFSIGTGTFLLEHLLESASDLTCGRLTLPNIVNLLLLLLKQPLQFLLSPSLLLSHLGHESVQSGSLALLHLDNLLLHLLLHDLGRTLHYLGGALLYNQVLLFLNGLRFDVSHQAQSLASALDRVRRAGLN